MTTPPPFEALRLARLSDVPRLGIVWTASFSYSPTFHFLLPKYKEFLTDTIASYAGECQRVILNPDSVILVAEHQYDKHESDHVFDDLRRIYPPLRDQLPHELPEDGKVNVGAVILSLIEDSIRQGKFQPEGQ